MPSLEPEFVSDSIYLSGVGLEPMVQYLSIISCKPLESNIHSLNYVEIDIWTVF